MVMTPAYRQLFDNSFGRILMRSLVSYWPLDEASGTRRDAVGSNSLTDNNTVTGGTGPSGALPLASQFTAANTETLSRVDNDTLSVEGQSFSFVIWSYFDSFGANRGIAGKDENSAGNREWFLRYSTAITRFSANLQNSGVNLISLTDLSPIPSTGEWYMHCLTFNAQTRQASLSSNARSRTTGTASGDITASGGAFRIGTEFGGSFMDGKLSAAALWKRVLTEAEETWLYNDGKGRAFPWR
jgi:hypothetical protein